MIKFHNSKFCISCRSYLLCCEDNGMSSLTKCEQMGLSIRMKITNLFVNVKILSDKMFSCKFCDTQ